MKDDMEEEKEIDPKDLLAEYDEYLKAKAEQKMKVDDSDDSDNEEAATVPLHVFSQNLDQFDYQE